MTRESEKESGVAPGPEPASLSVGLTSKQRKRLRGVAHSLKPVVHVGQKGLTEATMAEIVLALDAHELIKIRLASDREERVVLLERIKSDTGSDVVGSVGRMAVLYRLNAELGKHRFDPGKP